MRNTEPSRMLVRAAALAATAFGLAGCGSVTLVDIPSDPVAGIAGNQLAYASGAQTLAELEGQEMRVVLVRATSDYDANSLGIRVSEETLELAEGYLSGGSRDMVLTLDGVPIAFADGTGTASNGQTLTRFTYVEGTDAQVEGVFTYSDDDSEGFDVEALFVIGHETAPDTIATRSGAATYAGTFNGFGHYATGGRVITESEVQASGEVAMRVDFGASLVSGELAGVIGHSEGDIPLNGAFAATEIDGNGFAASLDVACPAGSTCDGASSLGGAFFGASGNEIGGLIAIDETRRSSPGKDGVFRYVGSAGMTLTAE